MFSDDKKNKHKEADGVNSKNSNDASDTKKSQGGKNERQFVNGGLDLVLTRNAFYRDKYYFTFFITIFLLFVVVVLFCIAYYFAFYPSKPQYFATTADGRMIRVHQLSDPVVPDDFVLQWTADAVSKAFDMDFIHWREQLQSASNNFTPDGWQYFINALESTNDLKTLVNLQMVSSGKVLSAPQVIQKAIIDGHYAWKIKMPILLTFTSASNVINQPMDIVVIVLREPVQYYPQKIAINNIFSQITGGNAFGSE